MDEITTLACECGEEVSGPNKASVTETMARHKAKKHPLKSAPQKAVKK